MQSDDNRLGSLFARLLGRQPSDIELNRLIRIRDVLEIKENDALWLVVATLESYDLEFKRYPDRMRRELDTTTKELRSDLRKLAAKLDQIDKSMPHPSHLPTEPSRLPWQSIPSWWTPGITVFACSILAGVSMSAGFVLGSGHAPWWLDETVPRSTVGVLVQLALQAPAGWIAMLCLIGVFGYSMARRSGLTMKRRIIETGGVACICASVFVSLFR